MGARDAESAPPPASTKRNVAVGYAYTATQVLFTLLTTPLLLGGLGVERYGVWVICNALVGYLELFELGFGHTVTTQLATYWGARDYERHRRGASTFLIVLAILGAVGMGVAVLMSTQLSVMVHVHGLLLAQARSTFLILAGAIALSIPLDMFGSILIAHQRLDMLDASLTVSAILQAAAWVGVLALGGGLVMLGVSTLCVSLVGQISRYVLARRAVPNLRLSLTAFDSKLVKEASKFSRWFVLGGVSAVVTEKIDVFLAGLVVNVPAAGAYSVAQRLSLGGSRLTRPATQLILPRAATLTGAEDEQGVRRVGVMSARVLVAITLPIALLLMVEASLAVHLWVGSSAAGAPTVLVFLAATMAFKAPLLALGYVMLGMGMKALRVTVLTNVTEGSVNLVLSIVLGNYMGLKGIAMASLIAAVASNLIVLLPGARRILGRQFMRSVGWNVLRVVPVGLAAAGAGLAVQQLHLQPLVALVLSSAALVATYVVGIVLAGVSRKERHAILSWATQSWRSAF